MRFLIFVLLIAVAALSISAQAKPVTNADLEKYRLEREKAELDYRENYSKRGFPSPEELARRREKSGAEDQEFANRLRVERLAAERSEAARQNAAAYYHYVPMENRRQDIDPYIFWSYGRPFRGPRQHVYSQPGYYAGGQFWPTPVRTPMRTPVWLPRR
jgi:hypothetical protein